MREVKGELERSGIMREVKGGELERSGIMREVKGDWKEVRGKDRIVTKKNMRRSEVRGLVRY